MTLAAVPAQIVTAQVVADWVTTLENQLRNKLGCPSSAEDLAHEAYVRFLQAQKANRSIRHPRAYLFQIGHHLLYQHYVGKRLLPECIELENETLVDDDAPVDEQAANALHLERINLAVAELSPKCRQALYLRWLEDYRIAEIAEAMNLSRAMVKKYLAKGLTHIRRRLGRYVLADQATD